MTAFQYDFNILPIGQQLWVKHLMTYKTYPAAAGAGDLQPGWDPEGNAKVCWQERLAALATPMRPSGRPRASAAARRSSELWQHARWVFRVRLLGTRRVFVRHDNCAA